MTLHKIVSAVKTRQNLIKENPALITNDFILLFNRCEIIHKKIRYKYYEKKFRGARSFTISKI